MAYYTRRHWTSTANRGPRFKRSQVHATLHYPGWGTDSIRTADWDLDRCLRQIRRWRNMHVGSGGYSEIAYNLFALPTGDVAEGRGNRQNGANGTSTSNRAGMSVQVMIGDNEPLTEGHLKAICAALSLLERWHPGITRRQYGHRHWVSTRCPGPYVVAGIPYPLHGTPTDGGSGGITGTVPGLSDGLAHVDDSQRWLRKLGYDAGPVDGIFGDQTEIATKIFQQHFGITPADGRPGPATREELETMANAYDELKQLIKDVPRETMHIEVPLEGSFEGQSGNLTGVRKWYAHDIAEIKAELARLIAFNEQIYWRADRTHTAVQEAVKTAGRKLELSDEQVQAIADAAAEAVRTEGD